MASRSHIDLGLQKAIEKLKASGKYGHVHGPRCSSEIQRVLEPEEETILEVRQSHFRNISPERIIATNRRLIIVRPSFWGHYFGFNMLRYTDISFVPYKQLISIVMSKGKFLSTIHMRIHGYTDVSSAIRNEGEIEGIRNRYAMAFTVFIEDVIEAREEEELEAMHQRGFAAEAAADPPYEKSITLENAARIVNEKSVKFVWLGIEPIGEVAAMLGTSTDNVVTFNTAAAGQMSKSELSQYKDCVFVSYSGQISRHLVKYLKREYDIDAYSLNRGILEIAKAAFEKFN
ncbi:MAG: PH domain-containing protein [Candidatus Micrarchaeota archaeon]|nr:PH domain-containing protein [Candidatus Micrarchaeota archaeon]